jgi:hypothetical protein
MSFRQWFRSLCTRWLALVQVLWPPTPRQQRQMEEAALTGQLQRQSRRLLRIRCRVERLRGRVHRQEERVQQLQTQVQESVSASAGEAAGPQALRLDRWTDCLQHMRNRLHRLERLYHRQRDRFDRCKGRLHALREAPVNAVCRATVGRGQGETARE